MHSKDILELDRRHVWHPFTQHQTSPDPIAIERAVGAELFTPEGERYLDLVSSWWVNIHGHGHPAIAKAIAEQAQKLEQVIFAGFTHEPAARLAGALSEQLPGDLNRVFFSDDGSTAIEVALKIAIQRSVNRADKRKRILAFEGGYHGDTVGAMSVGAGSGFFDAFDSMLFNVDVLPFPETWNDADEIEKLENAALAKLEKQLSTHQGEYAALIIEPLVQGAGGMRMCRPAFLKAMVERCQAEEVLVIFDEVMTGFGRTGKLFASLTAGVTPDLICLSKGLTAGNLPMSVTVCSDALFDEFKGDEFDRALAHGHSFTANSLGCAAALASLKLFTEGDAFDQIDRLVASHTEFARELTQHPKAQRVRQCGSIIAFDFATDETGYSASIGPKLKAFFGERRLLVRPLGNVVYLMPPYCTTQSQLDEGYAAILDALNQLG